MMAQIYYLLILSILALRVSGFQEKSDQIFTDTISIPNTKNLNIFTNNVHHEDWEPAQFAAEWDYKDQWRWNMFYPTCMGERQSPINVTQTMSRVTSCVIFENYQNQYNKPTFSNNGHTAIATAIWDYKHPTIFGGPLNAKYLLAQMHFHWGSTDNKGAEHIVNSKRYPLELHMVHYNAKYRSLDEAINSKQSTAVAVLTFIFEISSTSNGDLKPLYKALQSIKEPGSVTNLKSGIPLKKLPHLFSSDYISYQGSLTTPGCQQVVTWLISTKPMKISLNDIMYFRKLTTSNRNILVDNFRQLQQINEREVMLNRCQL